MPPLTLEQRAPAAAARGPVVGQLDGGRRPPRASCCRAAPRRRRPRAPRDLLEVGRTRRARAGPATVALAAATASAMPSPARWLSLNITQSDEVAAVVPAAPGPHRRLLERAQARRGLAGVPDAGRAAGRGRVDEARGEGGDAREVAEEVERGALAGEDRRQRPGRPCRSPSPAATASPSAAAQATSTRGSSWAKVSVAQAVPASTPSARGTKSATAVAPAGSSAEVRSPSGVRSSASARATASRTAWSEGRPQPRSLACQARRRGGPRRAR